MHALIKAFLFFFCKSIFFFYVTGVENLENFHGKALAGKGRDAVVKLKETLSNDPSLKNVLEPRPVQNDVESVELSVKLTELPHYSLGDKVTERCPFLFLPFEMSIRNVIAVMFSIKSNCL